MKRGVVLVLFASTALVVLAALARPHLPPVERAGVDGKRGERISPLPVGPVGSIAPLPAFPRAFSDLKKCSGLFVELEAALSSNPNGCRSFILERYRIEKDPAYKGLLAVLLAADPSTHPEILEDFKAAGTGDEELFKGMALFALVRQRDAAPSTSNTLQLLDDQPDFWQQLIGFMDFSIKEMALKQRRRDAPGDEEAQRLLDELHGVRRFVSDGMEITLLASHDEDRIVMRALGSTGDPAVRSALLDVLDKSWEWDLVYSVADYALNNSAEADPEFAGHLIREFMQREDRVRILKGFDLLGNSKLPDEHITTIADIARRSVNDERVFTDSVGLLGHQKEAESESTLMDLYALTRDRDVFKEQVLSAMITHLGPSFEPIARAEISSPSTAVRVRALELLAAINPAASIDPAVRVLVADPDPTARRSALWIIVEANRCTPGEEDALRRVAESDPHPRIREMAGRLRDSDNRIELDWWTSLDIDEDEDLLAGEE